MTEECWQCRYLLLVLLPPKRWDARKLHLRCSLFFVKQVEIHWYFFHSFLQVQINNHEVGHPHLNVITVRSSMQSPICPVSVKNLTALCFSIWGLRPTYFVTYWLSYCSLSYSLWASVSFAINEDNDNYSSMLSWILFEIILTRCWEL